MVVAHSLDLDKSPTKAQLARRKLAAGIESGLLSGMSVDDMAKKMGGTNRRKRARARKRILQILATDKELAGRIDAYTTAILRGYQMPVAESLGQVAMSGKFQSQKLLLEATRFHNTKVDHNHSGDIKITVDMPRPPRRIDPETDGDVVDADVVQD